MKHVVWFLGLVLVLSVSAVAAADSLDQAREAFQSLEKDPERSVRRDLWLALVQRFTALGASAPKEDGVRALWYLARSWEEIARRSHLSMDVRRAADAYSRLAQVAPKHSLADDALLRQAQIMARQGDISGAKAVLQRIVSSYPQGDMAAAARQELARLDRVAAKPAPTASTPPPAPPPAERAPLVQGGPPAAVTIQPKKQAGNLAEQLGLTIRTIVLDPGHGGKDPGAVVQGWYEKDINLRMARILGDMLRAKGFQVVLTRTKDTYLSLEERTRRANAAKGDLFLSIHCNAHADPGLHGFELYYLDLATDQQAARVAARENGVSEKKISDMQRILSDLLLQSKIEESKALARITQKEVMRTAAASWSLQDHGARGAFFYVLTGVRMPALLVELGYMTNPSELQRLGQDVYLRALAAGLTQGVVAYSQYLERFASSPSGGSYAFP